MFTLSSVVVHHDVGQFHVLHVVVRISHVVVDVARRQLRQQVAVRLNSPDEERISQQSHVLYLLTLLIVDLIHLSPLGSGGHTVFAFALRATATGTKPRELRV